MVAMPIATLPTYEWAGAAWALHLPEQDPGYGFVAEGIPEVSTAAEGTMLLEL